MKLKKRIRTIFIAFLAIYLLNLTYITARLYVTVSLSNFTYGEGNRLNSFVSDEIYRKINNRISRIENPKIAFDIYRHTSPIVIYWITGAKAVYWESEYEFDEYFYNLSGASLAPVIVDIELIDCKYTITKYNALSIPLWKYLKEKFEVYL